MLFTTLLVVGSIIVPSILFDDDEPTQVGLVEPAPAGLDLAMTATAAQFDLDLDVTTYPDDASADAALAAEEVDVVVDVPADLSGPGEVRFDQSEDEGLVQIVSASVAALRMQDLLVDAGIDPGELARRPDGPRGRHAPPGPSATRAGSWWPTSGRCSSSSASSASASRC